MGNTEHTPASKVTAQVALVANGPVSKNYSLASPDLDVPAHIMPAQISASFAQFGGINGKALTTALDVTFTTSLPAIYDFTADHITLTGADILDAAMRQDDKTFRVNIDLNPATPNGGAVSVLMTGFGNYMLMPDALHPNPGSVTVYKPVPMDTPDVAIDYARELLTGLAPNKYYAFRHGETGDFGDYHPASASGTYSLSDKEDWFDSTVYIKRQAEGDTVDSEPYELNILARPAEPATLTPTNDSVSGEGTHDGKITIIPAPESGYTWEYNRPALDHEWHPVDGTLIEDLHWGLYYVRQKATATSLRARRRRSM
jgi:hypothetical protein